MKRNLFLAMSAATLTLGAPAFAEVDATDAPAEALVVRMPLDEAGNPVASKGEVRLVADAAQAAQSAVDVVWNNGQVPTVPVVSTDASEQVAAPVDSRWGGRGLGHGGYRGRGNYYYRSQWAYGHPVYRNPYYHSRGRYYSYGYPRYYRGYGYGYYYYPRYHRH